MGGFFGNHSEKGGIYKKTICPYLNSRENSCHKLFFPTQQISRKEARLFLCWESSNVEQEWRELAFSTFPQYEVTKPKDCLGKGVLTWCGLFFFSFKQTLLHLIFNIYKLHICPDFLDESCSRIRDRQHPSKLKSCTHFEIPVTSNGRLELLWTKTLACSKYADELAGRQLVVHCPLGIVLQFLVRWSLTYQGPQTRIKMSWPLQQASSGR